MDDKTAKAVKALGINAKNEEDAREQILEILKKNEIEGMEDEELSTLIDIAEALVGDSKEDSEEDENDKLAKEVEDEEDADEDENDDDESEEEENVEEGGDELDDMDRSELKTYIKEHELNVKVTKKMEDDDIREAIREAIHAAEAENGNDEDEQDDEPEPEPEEKPAKGKKFEKKADKKAEKKEEEPAEKSNKNADKKAEKKADKKEKKEGGRKKTKIDPKNNNEDRKVFDVFKELFPEDNFNYNWVEGGVTIKHRGENSERGIVCMKPFYRKEDGLVGNMYIAALTKNTDVLDKNDIDYGFHWNDAPEMKNITIDEAYEILEKVQDVILEKVQKIDKKLGDNKAKMEKNLEKGAKKSDKKEEKEADVKADKKANKKDKKK